MVRSTLVASLLAVALSLGGARDASAECPAFRPLAAQIQAAKLVFVGTVISTSDYNFSAYVKVESIWKGPILDQYVRVSSPQVMAAPSATALAREYQRGTEYLFVLSSADAPLQDSPCGGTQPYTAAIAALAPPDARLPVVVGYPTDPQVQPRALILQAMFGALVVVFVIVFAALVIVVLRRRSKRA